MTDTITILRSRGPRLTKLIRADGSIVGYDEARTYHGIEHEIENLDDLLAALTWLSSRADRCIVRAALVDPGRTSPIRRLLYRDPVTGDEPTLREVPHHWLATDWDTLERPDDLDVTDLPGCAGVALARLPASFHGAACIVQATGSHGVKPGIRIRMWHWLVRPLTGAEVGRWLDSVTGIDRSVFRPAQIIYAAAPVFETGRDHLPYRIAMIPGVPHVEPPSAAALAPLPPKPTAPLPQPGDAKADRYAWAALRNAAARVASSGEGDRHPTIFREARSLARFIAAGLLSRQAVMQTLETAAQCAGKPQGEASAVLAWAIAHPSPADLKIAS
ncbi:hypothetical protein [Acidiphilium iwatense]|uniref:Uncharacterized protein n=1 Tax=Acidiphilium iwatense TaxID=768198 RepID=A0ABS9E141_9PROT|nr:hypothetical protein [Acidiphilium iwatense]MCF3947755.1 hypothetical protein [Acidiphilium iwatense]